VVDTAVGVGQICTRLERSYGNPRHGNKRSPLDELVYIILSNRTRAESYRDTFRRLKRAFLSWAIVRSRTLPRLHRPAIHPAGSGQRGTGSDDRVQLEQDIAYCDKESPSSFADPSPPSSSDDLIALFELTIDGDEVSILDERHSLLVPQIRSDRRTLRR